MEARAKLNNVPTSPRKMRLVANMVRGQKVTRALGLLKFEAAIEMTRQALARLRPGGRLPRRGGPG